jgi:hypothetical protein
MKKESQRLIFDPIIAMMVGFCCALMEKLISAVNQRAVSTSMILVAVCMWVDPWRVACFPWVVRYKMVLRNTFFKENNFRV